MTTKSTKSKKSSSKSTASSTSTRKSAAPSPPAASDAASLPASEAASSPVASTLPPGFVRVSARGHQLSIAGRVVDARTRRVLPKAEVSLTDGPEAWRAWVTASGVTPRGEPPDRTVSSDDGTFRFVDLPDGRYTLTARLPAASTRYGTVAQQVEVSPERGPFPLTVLALPPTAVEGVVRGAGEADGGGTSPSPAPLSMARVRVMGSGESALTDSDGRYLLHGIEPGTRTVQVSARGFDPARLPAGVEQGVVTSLDVLLERPPLEGKTRP